MLSLFNPEASTNESPDHDLTLVIPAFNEESRLPKTLRDAKQELDSWNIDYRVLVVDDGSRDATSSIAENFGRRFTTLSKPNGGKGSAVRLGMLQATGTVVAFTDADLPYDMSALKTAYHKISSTECDVVFGSRTITGSTNTVSRKLSRQIASKAFQLSNKLLVSRHITDTQCGLKAFSRSAAQCIFTRTQIDGFAFDAEVVFLTHRLKLTYQLIPVVLVNEYASTISLTRNAIPMQLDVLRVRLRAMRGGYRAGAAMTRSETPMPSRKAA